MKRICVAFAVLLTFVATSLSQQTTTTVKGYVCKSSHSQDETAGFLTLRVGDELIEIDHKFAPNIGDIAGMTKSQISEYTRKNTTRYLPSKKGLDERIGAELIVTYKKTSYGYNWAVSIKSTGRRKRTTSCG